MYHQSGVARIASVRLHAQLRNTAAQPAGFTEHPSELAQFSYTSHTLLMRNLNYRLECKNTYILF